MARVASLRRGGRRFVATAFSASPSAQRSTSSDRSGGGADAANVRVGLLLVPALAMATTPAGRCQGAVEVPGRPLALVVDLAQDANGRSIGSLIVPALTSEASTASGAAGATTRREARSSRRRSSSTASSTSAATTPACTRSNSRTSFHRVNAYRVAETFQRYFAQVAEREPFAEA